MFLARRKPDHVARPDFFLGTGPPLHPSETGGNDQRLAQRLISMTFLHNLIAGFGHLSSIPTAQAGLDRNQSRLTATLAKNLSYSPPYD
jgi:hypothetical protein